MGDTGDAAVDGDALAGLQLLRLSGGHFFLRLRCRWMHHAQNPPCTQANPTTVSGLAAQAGLRSNQDMNTKTAIELAGSGQKLANLLGVKRQAVQGWQKRGSLPDYRVGQLVQLRPEWFKVTPA